MSLTKRLMKKIKICCLHLKRVELKVGLVCYLFVQLSVYLSIDLVGLDFQLTKVVGTR